MEHWWDLWKFAVNQFTKKLRYPPGKEAWDIFVLYGPRMRWDGNLPDPTFWMQNHNLDVGPKYEKEKLEAELGQLQ